jgi:hypothetical protein
LVGVKSRTRKGAAPVEVVVNRQQGLPPQPGIDNQPGSRMIGVLYVQPEHVLTKIVELRTALTKRIHLACKEVQQRIVAILAAKIEDAVVLIVIDLHVPSSEQVHAEGNLVLAAQNIHIVSLLEAGDREST